MGKGGKGGNEKKRMEVGRSVPVLHVSIKFRLIVAYVVMCAGRWQRGLYWSSRTPDVAIRRQTSDDVWPSARDSPSPRSTTGIRTDDSGTVQRSHQLRLHQHNSQCGRPITPPRWRHHVQWRHSYPRLPAKCKRVIMLSLNRLSQLNKKLRFITLLTAILLGPIHIEISKKW